MACSRWRRWSRWPTCGGPSCSPGGWCLAASALFFGYILARALTSPVAYIAWDDEFMVIGCLMLYLLTACYFTDPRRRLWVLGILMALAAVNLAVGRAAVRGRGQFHAVLVHPPRAVHRAGRAASTFARTIWRDIWKCWLPESVDGALEPGAGLGEVLLRVWRAHVFLAGHAAHRQPGGIPQRLRGHDGADAPEPGAGEGEIAGMVRPDGAAAVIAVVALAAVGVGLALSAQQAAPGTRPARCSTSRHDVRPAALGGGGAGNSRFAPVRHGCGDLRVLWPDVPRSADPARPDPRAQRLPRTAGRIRRAWAGWRCCCSWGRTCGGAADVPAPVSAA